MEVADLNSLVIFAKVVEAKGFSEAAPRLKDTDLHRKPPRR
jgi:hypothetical protein